MTEINLGSGRVYKVKINGEVHEMRAPRAKYVNEWRKKLDNKSADEIDLFIKLCVDHGLPQDIADDLDVVQLQTLAEGLQGNKEKK